MSSCNSYKVSEVGDFWHFDLQPQVYEKDDYNKSTKRAKFTPNNDEIHEKLYSYYNTDVSINLEYLFQSSISPKPVAFLTLPNNKICVLAGYNIASVSPNPKLFFGSDALPEECLEYLLKFKACAMSVARVQDADLAHKLSRGGCLDMKDLGLLLNTKSAERGEEKKSEPSEMRVPAVMECDLQMQCILSEVVKLNEDKSIIVVEVQSCQVSHQVLREDANVRQGTNKRALRIEVDLVQPLCGIGADSFGKLESIYHMYRPKKREDEDDIEDKWIGDEFSLFERKDDQIIAHDDLTSKEKSWLTFSSSDASNVLGYNISKQIVIPRPIGWISTYHSSGISHVAPYSFYTNVGNYDKGPMVAFVSYGRKDALTDAEKSGCFVCNAVTEEQAYKMNLSSAELPSNKSEFELASITEITANSVKAPTVKECPVTLECEYVLTKDMGGWYIVVGKVVAMNFRKDIISATTPGHLAVDVGRLRPVTRLGYAQEYGVAIPL